MTTTIVALVLISAAFHPLREYFIKGDATPEGVTLAVVIQFWALAGLHGLFVGDGPWVALKVWPMMLVSSGSTLAVERLVS